MTPITSPTDYSWWADPDYDSMGRLIGEEIEEEEEYNADLDLDWGRHGEDE